LVLFSVYLACNLLFKKIPNLLSKPLRFIKNRITLLLLLLCISTWVYGQVPVISSFSPASGPAGTMVTINGNNFGTSVGNNAVYFGATKAAVINASATQLTVRVPGGSTYLPISVTNTDTRLMANSTVPFIPTFSNSNQALVSADFNVPQQIPSISLTSSIITGDIDGDGKPDVVVTNPLNAVISVFLNAGFSGAITRSSFAPGVTIGAGGADPDNVQLADLNGDGLLDMVARSGSWDALIYINNSTPGHVEFAPPIDVIFKNNTIATTLSHIIVTDVDKDGRPDLVASCISYENKTTAIMRNTSTSGVLSFATEVDFDGGNNVLSIDAADMDGDGLPDLLIVNGTVTVMRNTSTPGNINFSAPVNLGLANYYEKMASLGDLDGDGKPDIIITDNGNLLNPATPSISVLRNTSVSGSISFATATTFTSGGQQVKPVIADMNGDGKPDVVSIGNGTVNIFRNISTSGNIALDKPAALNYSISPSDLAIFDINNDGRPDVVTAQNGFGNCFATYQNNLQFTTLPPAPVVNSFSPASGVSGTTVTISGNNFNTTAANNIVFFGAVKTFAESATATQITVKVPAGANHQPISVLNTGTHLSGTAQGIFVPSLSAKIALNFYSKTNFNTGSLPKSAIISDIDGDGKPDMVVITQGNTLSFYRNISANGVISSTSFATKIDVALPYTPQSFRIADINADGKPDIIVVCANDLITLRNTSLPGSISMASALDFYSNTIVDVSIVDLDGDGRPEIVALLNGNEYTIYRNTSVNGNADGTSFTPTNIYITTNYAPSKIAFGDMDGDGKMDIVVTTQQITPSPAYGYSSVMVYRNTSSVGSISLAAPVTTTVSPYPTALSLSDIDGDGKLDILTAITSPGATDSYFDVILNNSTKSNLSFGAPVMVTVGVDGVTFAIGDVDGDAKPDIAVLNRNTVYVYSNTSTTGKVTFAARAEFGAGLGAAALDIGDLDGDGKADIVVANLSDNTISVLHNDPNATPAPRITALSDYIVIVGTRITITGVNFTGVTSVTFGGVPATSFTVNSATSISATIGAGPDGPVVVTSPGGTSSFDKISFLPVPTITANGPVNFLSGSSVTLSAKPDNALIYQWFNGSTNVANYFDGTSTLIVSQSGVYTVKISQGNVSQTSLPITITVKYNLPAKNFAISTIGATCKGSANGSVYVISQQSGNFTATVTGNNVNKTANFNSSVVSVGGLSAGTYNLCITLSSQPDYQQCYTFVITEPKNIALFSTISPDNKNVTLALSGGSIYNIQLNGVLHTTTDSSITLPLSAGRNSLIVTTDKPCQGVIDKTITASDIIIPYPDPFENTLYLSIGNQQVKKAMIEVYSSMGVLVYKSQFNSLSNTIKLDFSTLKMPGAYTLKLTVDSGAPQVFKVIKK